MKTLQKTILALAITFTTTYSFAQTAYEKAMLLKLLNPMLLYAL